MHNWPLWPIFDSLFHHFGTSRLKLRFFHYRNGSMTTPSRNPWNAAVRLSWSVSFMANFFEFKSNSTSFCLKNEFFKLKLLDEHSFITTKATCCTNYATKKRTFLITLNVRMSSLLAAWSFEQVSTSRSFWSPRVQFRWNHANCLVVCMLGTLNKGGIVIKVGHPGLKCFSLELGSNDKIVSFLYLGNSLSETTLYDYQGFRFGFNQQTVTVALVLSFSEVVPFARNYDQLCFRIQSSIAFLTSESGFKMTFMDKYTSIAGMENIFSVCIILH